MPDIPALQYLPLMPQGTQSKVAAASQMLPVLPAIPQRLSKDYYESQRPPAALPATGATGGGFDRNIFSGIWIPPTAVKPNGRVDVVFHLHGATGIPYKQMGLNAVVVSIQPPGKGLSKLFVDHYQATGGFANWVTQLRAYLKARVGTDQIDRIAISSFSAGFGGVREILRSRENRARIDTVILLDSLHIGNNALTTDSPGLKPFAEFAMEAAQGRKTMVVTHSELDPVKYASTTKTARVLLQATGAQEHPYTGPNSTIQSQLTAADAGNFHVLGYAGNDAQAHMKQLQIASEIWPKYLVHRWNAAPDPGRKWPAAPSPGNVPPVTSRQANPQGIRFLHPPLSGSGH